MDSADKVKSYVNLLERNGSDRAASRTTRKQSLTNSAATRIQKILRPKIALRLVGICILGCLTGFLIFNSPYWMTGIWTALGTVALFYETVRFVDQSERKLHSFLQALHQSDFSVTFSENMRAANYDLHHAFNQLNETFKVLRADKESQHQLLQTIVESAAVPMICYEEKNGEVHLMNEAAKKLLNVPFLQHIKALGRVDPGLPNFLLSIRDGEKESLKLMLNGKPVFLSVTSRHILFKSKSLKVSAFHDVSSELAIREAETWQKLLRVLTHEISNSAIPLSTLSSYICEIVSRAEQEMRTLSNDERNDVLTSLKTIEQRSKSLKEFVQNFRSVNQIPEPKLERININELIDEVGSLFIKELQRENIRLTIVEPKEVFLIYADRSLTVQVLINLMKNAIESMANLKEDKTIFIAVEKIGVYINLSVGDTGCGITSEDLEQIFIPFYSTKKAGSGIGLSISQQIMQKQKGDISVQSVSGKGSVFTLSFSG
jgi:nitrogen fixation/metabolism regulation signal transduction histidine kinase